MNYEVEQKFRLEDATALEATAAALGAKLGPAVVQADQYFAHPARDFARTDEALRIRSVGEDNRVTYKGPKIDATTKTRRELELVIEPGAQGAARFAELLAALGFVPVATVRKQRRTAIISWQGRQVELAVDCVDRLGHFCELELSADESDVAGARAAVTELAARLGLTEGERRSYLELLLGA
ncbi:MAG: class IV adenylate cyclase [Planctomycetia bacterium]|nr:class IV adenylate cyclase [Planctomycetia bacterium]